MWGLRYIDYLVIRDRSPANNGTINERRYAMQDGNLNSIAICDSTGSVGERYAYSAYGAPVFMTECDRTCGVHALRGGELRSVCWISSQTSETFRHLRLSIA